jgi:Spy/CpxP family protein refolding chaperone
MVSLVERMLALHKLIPSQPSPAGRGAKGGGGRTPQEQEMVKREIESTDRQIDQLVYELYGLSPEEIKIVEGNG